MTANYRKTRRDLSPVVKQRNLLDEVGGALTTGGFQGQRAVDNEPAATAEVCGGSGGRWRLTPALGPDSIDSSEPLHAVVSLPNGIIPSP